MKTVFNHGVMLAATILIAAVVMAVVIRTCYPLDTVTLEQCQAIIASLESPLVFRPHDYAEAVEHCNSLK
jgi:hypothetical protein